MLLFYAGFLVPFAPLASRSCKPLANTNNPGTNSTVSGYRQDADRRRALMAGFDRLCVKPLRIEELDALLSELRAQAV